MSIAMTVFLQLCVVLSFLATVAACPCNHSTEAATSHSHNKHHPSQHLPSDSKSHESPHMSLHDKHHQSANMSSHDKHHSSPNMSSHDKHHSSPNMSSHDKHHSSPDMSSHDKHHSSPNMSLHDKHHQSPNMSSHDKHHSSGHMSSDENHESMHLSSHDKHHSSGHMLSDNKLNASSHMKKHTLCPPNCSDCHGKLCRRCNNGWYGKDCSKPCIQCPSGCRKDTRHCLSCPGGAFGANCTESCPVHCKADKGRVRCNTPHGHCEDGCMDGYYGNTCTRPCGRCIHGTCFHIDGKCKSACETGYYGNTCRLTCGFCSDGSCSQSTGLCEGECQAGYYGLSCELQCENCSCGNCSQTTGQCDTACTVNGQSQPSTSLTTGETTRSPSCPANCLQCEGDVCTSCNTGWYGADCSIACSTCTGSCSQELGHCLSCPDGAFGDNCTELCHGKCGTNNEDNVRCDATNGRCIDGCMDGYYGDTCTLPCGHCITVTCLRNTGHCENGCMDGYHGDTCKITCGFCSTKSCSQSSGLCENGCSEGYYGASCDLSCHNCSCGNCSQHTGWCDTDCLDNTHPEDQHENEVEDVAAPRITPELEEITKTDDSHPTPLRQSQNPGTSKATVDTAVGVTFALMLMVIAVFVLMCSKYRKLLTCSSSSGRRQGETSGKSKQDVALYVEDDLGSPKLTRNNETAEEYKLVPTAPPVEDGARENQ